ncbi:hypothetical protein TNCT_310711 [Trichonephila clavata]|uniref:Uncharacterized protein n=1 Tax=Trichonephila clavata TaxID=2740835 RepID=A0A8X6GIW0_TRICU|nr:hypothetical protein TNCT_310711 [Trichonephila clavata]
MGVEGASKPKSRRVNFGVGDVEIKLQYRFLRTMGQKKLSFQTNGNGWCVLAGKVPQNVHVQEELCINAGPEEEAVTREGSSIGG